MTLAEMIAEVQAATDQGTSGRIAQTTYRRWTDQEYQTVRRMLGDLVPTLYLARVSFSITSGNSWAISPATWGKAYRIERDGGAGNYTPLGVASPLDPELIPGPFTQVYLERAGNIDIFPELTAPGSYRATYVAQPARLATDGTSDATAIDVPAEFEAVIVEGVSARVRVNQEEDPSPHLRARESALREAKWNIRKRYGIAAEPGVVRSS